MRKQGYVLVATLFITLTFSSVVVLSIQTVDAQTGNFPTSHAEVNSMIYQTASRYIFSDIDKITGFNRSVTLTRTFPSDGKINVTESWTANSTLYSGVNNDLYLYTINETTNEKQDFSGYPSYLTGFWMQRFPSNTSTQNITIPDLSAIVGIKIAGKPMISDQRIALETELGTRDVYVVQISGNFEQNCAS